MPYPRTGTGGGSARFVLVAGSPFVDVPALEAWASANPTLLFNDAEQISTAFVDNSLYQYRGVTGVYEAGQWSDETPDGLTPEMMAALNSIINLPDGAVPQGSSGELIGSGVSSTASTIETSKSIQSGLNSFFLDEAYAIESSGRSLTVRNRATNDVFRLLVASTSNLPSILVDRPTQTFLFQPDDSETITNPSYDVTIPVVDTANPEDGQYVRSFIVRVDPSSVLTNWVLTIEIDGVAFHESTYETVTPTGPNNEYSIVYMPPLDVLVDDNLTGIFSSPDGDIVLLGDSNGVPYQNVTLDLSDIRTLAFAEDIPHPVTLRRDMPSAEDSLELVNASLNQNSGLWIVANNQLSNSNRGDATIFALQPGFLDLDGNEIPTSPVAANTIQLRGGTTVRVFGQNDFRVVNAPVLESDITNGMQPGTPQPRFTRFEFESQETSVAPGTTISGLKTFLINVNRPDLITGHLTILQDNVVLTQDTLLPTVRSAGVPINSSTLTNAGDTVTFTIRATTTAGATINSHITVRAAQPHEFAYWGIRPSNDFAAASLGLLNSVDITTNSQFDVTGDYPSGSFIGILVPETHDARTISISNFPAKDEFTRTANARVINSVNYILYTLENAGSVSGAAAYSVEV